VNKDERKQAREAIKLLKDLVDKDEIASTLDGSGDGPGGGGGRG
jgi:hypothetical protein